MIKPKQRSKDRPSSYCCELMEFAIEDTGYIQYEERERQYIFVNAKGRAVLLISYCPFCGAHIPGLGPLMEDKFFEYVVNGEALTEEEFDRHWPIILQDLPMEETMRLIAEKAAREQKINKLKQGHTLNLARSN